MASKNTNNYFDSEKSGFNNHINDKLLSKSAVNEIANYMSKTFKVYLEIKGQKKEKRSIPFWDVVVLTTCDEEQKKAFELQLASKETREELPKDLPFHVISDLSNTKSGNGGATINALAELRNIYDEKLKDMRTLMIHAGGLSQRLPSASVLGKVFTTLPIGDQTLHILDLKLAMFIPLLSRMTAGVLVTCADDIVPYVLEDSGDWTLENIGFTALAHPSTLDIAATHGVYVLDNADKTSGKSIENYKCLEVLQKPSIETIYQKNAVVKVDGNEYAFTDSVFFFDYSVTQKFLRFYDNVGPIKCEIDGYGDFLQALGPNASKKYVKNCGNITSSTNDLPMMREKVYELLSGTPITVIVLRKSKFFHIGTTQEYIENLCENEHFAKMMCLKKQCFNALCTSSNTETNGKLTTGRLDGCVMFSRLSNDSTVGSGSIVEFCNFISNVEIGENCIVSNCEFTDSPIQNLSAHTVCIPNNTFLHTLPVHHENRTSYCTLMFHIHDNLKYPVTPSNVGKLPIFAQNLDSLMKIYSHKSAKDFFSKGCTQFNLWHAKLFPVMGTMTESLTLTLRLRDYFLDSAPDDDLERKLKGARLFSMKDVLDNKDVDAMLMYRDRLHKVIKWLNK